MPQMREITSGLQFPEGPGLRSSRPMARRWNLSPPAIPLRRTFALAGRICASRILP